MSVTVRDPNSPPASGWQYPAIAGPNIKSPDYSQLYGRVVKHYRANAQEPPSREAVNQWLCDNLPVRCDEGNAPYRNKFTDPPTYAQRGMKGPAWPLALIPIKLLANETDRGLGDIVARVIGPIGGDAFKKWYKAIFGTPCGCKERQEDWNATYPL